MKRLEVLDWLRDLYIGWHYLNLLIPFCPMISGVPRWVPLGGPYHETRGPASQDWLTHEKCQPWERKLPPMGREATGPEEW